MTVDRVREALTARRLATGLAGLAAVVVFTLAHDLFPYHSINHDEGVYLQQAEMLLAGTLRLQPPVQEAFRPWFFVADGSQLYPKYSPVAATMFAIGKLLGGFRLALAGLAAGTVALTYATVREAFDARTAVTAAVLLLASPFFLLQASVFLPYVPTFSLTLLFAWAYLRADRTGDLRFAALAGAAIGMAFFSRPYTAVLFAAPFLCHALWQLRTLSRPVLRRQGTTAALGLVGVAVTLAYNGLMTGSPTTFPYLAFAPNDGLGFGAHSIVGYERVYSIPLALEANSHVLASYLLRWAPAGPLGSLLALGGLATVLRRLPGVDPRKLVLAGLAVSIPLGQVYFWGNLNILGDIDRVGDGLISYLGPYYHLGVLLPTVAFGAVALWRLHDVVRARVSLDGRRTRALAAIVLVVLALPAGGLAVGAVTAQVSDNAGVTDRYERAYEPFEGRDFGNALVFLPTPLGDWLNHPFQYLRNDPGYDGTPLYAIRERQFAVVEEYPDRRLYRYVYRGEWIPTAGPGVTPHLQRIRHVAGERVNVDFGMGMPGYARSASLRLSGRNTTTHSLDVEAGESVRLTATVSDSVVRVTSPALAAPVSAPVPEDGPVELRVFVDTGTVSSFSYRAELPVDAANGTTHVLTPALEVCRSPRNCGGEAAYVPGAHRPGIEMEATVHG